MFIAHLPAGYIVSSFAHDHIRRFAAVPRKHFIACGMIGSIFPDLDLLYFFAFDQRSHHHHTYWTHLPLFWLITLASLLLIFHFRKKPQLVSATVIFGINVFLHLVLDTLVGDIWWLYPFADRPFALFTVAALYHPWWLNFMLHWSFLVEMTLTIIAIYLFNKRKIISQAL